MPDSIVMASRKFSSSEMRWDEPALRELLAGQLARMLRVRPMEIDSAKSFDEYGLDSIDAVIATELIGERLGIELPPEFLLINRSVDAVVRALLERQRSSSSADTRRCNGAPIFLVPGGGGRDEPSLIRFRAQSTPTLTFEVVHIGNWRDWIENDLDFDGLVACACRQIEAAGAEGALQLAGQSQGGQLAYAAALSLSRAGRPVGFVGLLDTNLEPSPRPSILKAALRFAGRYIRAMVRKELYTRGRIRVGVFVFFWRLCRGPGERRKLLMFIERYGRLLSRGPGGVILDLAIQMALFAQLWSAWCRKNGPVRSLHSPVFLFRSNDPGSPDRGWQAWCSDLKIVPVAGGHHTMFDEEHMGGLVTRFAAAVRSVA